MHKSIEPHNNRSEVVCQGQWLSLHRITFTNKHGEVKTWECAARLHRRGAAMMIAKLEPSGRVVLVRQFRPPLNGRVLEFPAGLIDDGENAAMTAVRELREETGYEGKVVEVFPPTCNSPGLTGEKITTVLMTVDESTHQLSPPEPAMEADEDIETIAVPLDELHDFIRSEAAAGGIVDSKLLAFAMALNYR